MKEYLELKISKLHVNMARIRIKGNEVPLAKLEELNTLKNLLEILKLYGKG